MAELTQQEMNFVSRQVERAQRLLDLRDDFKRDVALYNALGFGETITDAKLVGTLINGVPVFAYLTQSSIWNVVTAQTAALGDDVGGQAVNLIKMQS